MATVDRTPSQAVPPSNPPPHARPRHRRPRGGHTQVQQNGPIALSNGEPSIQSGQDAGPDFRSPIAFPSSQPRSAEPSSAENSAAEVGSPQNSRYSRGRAGYKRGYGRMRGNRREGASNRGGDGRRGGRGARAMNESPMLHDSMIQPRGSLATSAEANEPITLTSALQADAPEFRPGQQHHPRATTTRGGRAPKVTAEPSGSNQTLYSRRGSVVKSTALDIATRIHEDIAHGAYECPICTSEVGKNSKIWSCKTCWTVFHLTCIKKWSQNEGSTLAQQRNPDGDLPPPRQWRCPGCNLPKDVLPSAYSCWCEKEVDPRPILAIPPHSCGQTCGKHRVLPRKCPHPCNLLCHAGPCPPCTHQGPNQSCFCGKQSTSRRCVDTNYDTGWSCEEICGDVMPCGEHTCSRPCHEGLCGACEVELDARCYCGKSEKTIACCERDNEQESRKVSVDQKDIKIEEEWMGIFNCGGVCGRPFDCENHVCEKRCHSQELNPAHCPKSPDVVSHCTCGKTPLIEIIDEPRRSCEDPIPNCGKQCSKKLHCGHSCKQICHSGPCMPCLETVSINCRCGRTTSATVCHQGTEEAPQCMRVCRVTLNCGRHECGERCCSGERRAVERQATKRKLRPLGAAPRVIDEGIEAEHICTRLCGRLLKCGNHQCSELCHKGPCGTCREAIFDEIPCHCGRTVLQPPLPCGTKPPPCRHECERGKNCGHPQVPHNCHEDQESCPKCPFLTEKTCMCGKRMLKNQQCWLTDVRCGEVCGRKLRCGSHFCRKPCHRPGGCEDAGRSCQQACGRAKKVCGHPCEELCHAPSSCREDKACQNKMLVTCDCQHLKLEVKCNASKASDGNSKKTLKCDDECARLERNRRLALALNIDPEAHKDDHIPYSASTLHMFQDSVKWAQSQEREFRVFATDEAEKRLRFKPMQPHQRAFIHALAEDFGLDSESMDPEPHRHVLVLKTPRFVMAPMKTLAECIRIRTAAMNEAASVTLAEAQRKSQASNEPFNGFLLTSPRFGLTLDELRIDCSQVLESAPGLAFDVSFLPSEQIVLKAHNTNISTSFIDASLRGLKSNLSAVVNSKHLASSVYLCTLDKSLNIVRRESDPKTSDGWSQVAAKAATGPRSAPRQMAIGGKSSFTVLGNKSKDAKKKREDKEKEMANDVVDDWEEEVRKEEEKNKAKEIVSENEGEIGRKALGENIERQDSVLVGNTSENEGDLIHAHEMDEHD